MNRVIFKSALVTIATVILAALLTFGLWILISPQTMADACERTGNYSLAVVCADMRYGRTGDAHDLLRCVEDSILSGKDELIVKYGEQLIKNREDFERLCDERDGVIADGTYARYTSEYRVYICGWVAAAQYREGNLGNAIATANKCLSSKSFNRLVLAVIERGTPDAAEMVKEELEKALKQSNELNIFTPEDKQNAKGLIGLLNQLIESKR